MREDEARAILGFLDTHPPDERARTLCLLFGNALRRELDAIIVARGGFVRRIGPEHPCLCHHAASDHAHDVGRCDVNECTCAAYVEVAPCGLNPRDVIEGYCRTCGELGPSKAKAST